MPKASVLIVMCTWNGARWLPAQLDSIAAQTHKNWALWVSDDGSTDTTPDIIAAFQTAHPGHDIRLSRGPQLGAAQNFLAAICHADLPIGPQTHLALCDQDDIWWPEKLARGLAVLGQQPDADRPLIYGAQSVHITSEGRPVGHSRRPRRPVTVQNAVVQNMVSGHSLLLNPSAVAVARAAGQPTDVAFQDWWLGLLILATGGRAVIDQTEVLFYRQHDTNVMGAPQGVLAQLRRIKLLLGGQYQRWVMANLAGLTASPVTLTPEAARIVDQLRRAKGGLARLRCLRALGVHRQSRIGTALLYLAAALGLA